MKITKKAFLIFISTLMLVFQPITVLANTSTVVISKEYLSDGSYFETVIESNDTLRSTIKNASKTTTYKNADGNALWYARVTANFYFDGKTSSCTSASASGEAYVDTWKIQSKSSSRTGNVGSATVIAGCYFAGINIGNVSQTVTLACDKNGNLS